jgi:hypothetical protein
MRPQRVGLANRRHLHSAIRVCACTLALTLAPSGRGALAQTPTATTPNTTPSVQASPSTATPPPIQTLHVYANLEQIPVLVLTADHLRVKSVDTSKFRVSLDSGRLFTPAHIRREGDDPISLAILIDTSRPKNALLPQLAQSLAELPPHYLQPQDRIAVYQFDCNLIRTMYFKPADLATLKSSLNTALADWQSHREPPATTKNEPPPPTPPPCKQSMPLWDSMTKAIADLGQQPGRRVLLVVTDGQDDGSKSTWTQVMNSAQIESVAVFALTNIMQIQVKSEAMINREVIRHSPLMPQAEDKLDQICELSGGLEIEGESRFESYQLKEFTQMLRERYILEYPRGKDRKAGRHSLQVALINGDSLYVRPSGTSAPIASQDEINGLNTTPANPSSKPVEGKRRVLPPSTQ